MTLVPLSRFESDDPGFNHAAAEQVFGEIMALDPEAAEVYSVMLVSKMLATDLVTYEPEISKALGDVLERRGGELRQGLVRSFVSKRLAGEDVDSVLAAGEELSKAFDQFDFSSADRARRAHDQQRDLATGQFKRTHHQIEYGDQKPMKDSAAMKLGIPTTDATENLSAEKKAQYQDAYAQVAALVEPYKRLGDNAFLHLTYPTGEEIHALGKGPLPLSPNKKLHSASVSVLPGPAGVQAAPYDSLRAIGGATAASFGNDTKGVDAIRSARVQANTDVDPFIPSSRLFARLGAGSKFLDDAVGNALPGHAQLALKVGQHVGAYGPEAQKVMGPTADRTAYRYRGTERTPDQSLLNRLTSIKNDARIPRDAKRDFTFHGEDTDLGWKPSPVLNYFRAHLPNPDLNTLQRKSGTIPPSEGVILDKNGKVAVQAVGYGDDHYLPFNLKNLRALKGGEYIRTRTWGGPTTEDIYTGLISGAHSVTVASHNGSYTVEFDPSFKGGARYNDKAYRMVARYGHLLDAVKNGEITTGQIAPSRIAELRTKAESYADPDTDPADYESEFSRLLTRERRNPQFSQAQRAEAATNFLDAEADKVKAPDGREVTRTELVDTWLNRQSATAYANYLRSEATDAEANDFRIKGIGRVVGMTGSAVAPPMTQDDFKREIATKAGLNDPDPARFSENAVRAMGLGDKFDRYAEREEATYKAGLQPLELNGAGYDLALKALQEQFPYYISRVSYHPWQDARPGRDTGYVKPKHNRPADVLAGYFDTGVNGMGKVRADSIRGQGHGGPRPYETQRDKVKAAIESKRPGGTGGKAALDPNAARELRAAADLDLLGHIRSQTRFGPDTTSAGTAHKALDTAKNEDLSGYPDDDIQKVLPGLHGVTRGLSDEDLRKKSATPEGADELHQRLTTALAEIEKHKLFNLDSDRVKAFRSEGRAEAAAKFDKTNVGPALAGIDEEHDFGAPAYNADKGPTVDQVKSAYTSISARAKELGLPLDIDSPDFGSAASAAQSNLSTLHGKWLAWQRAGADRSMRPAGVERLPNDVETLARAKQLRRRYDQALQVPADVPSGEGSIGFGGAPVRGVTVTPGADGSYEIGFTAKHKGGHLTAMDSSGSDLQRPGWLQPL